MEHGKWRWAAGWCALWMFCSSKCCIADGAELAYSVSEELKAGSFVGDIAKDLALDFSTIARRNLRVVSDSDVQYFEVNPANGALLIRQPVERESVCGLSPTCLLHVQIMLDNPMEVSRVLVEITDVNDNAPRFPAGNISLEMSEAAAPGSRVRLESAHDPDVGINSLRTYILGANDCFTLNVVTKSDGSKFPELVLEKALDREKQESFSLLLTALDGGRPERSGTTVVLINILDVNDNAPVFEEPVKRVSVLENSVPGTLVTKLVATDADSGSNGEVSFMFSKYTPEHALALLSVDSETGEVRVKGELDYEVTEAYDVTVLARDSGSPAMEGSCNVKVQIIDVNDNAPEINVKSLPSPVREDVELGTVVAFFSVKDKDSGKNGEVTLQISGGMPFKLTSPFGGHYTVVTAEALDREVADEYTLVVTATDSGSPPLSSRSTFTVNLLDVNDNAPVFSQPSYTVEVPENGAPGTQLISLSALDPDSGDNGRLSFSVLPSVIHGSPVSSYVYVDAESGSLRAVRSLDHEQMNAFCVDVQVRDAGVPAQSSNVTVHVFVLDQNDNSPAVVYPSFPEGHALQLSMPNPSRVGYLINRIVAVDLDSGHNAWLFYSIAPGLHADLFRIGPHTGELRTAHKLGEEEEEENEEQKQLEYNIVVVVQDNGKPSLSTSVAVTIIVQEKHSHTSSDSSRTSSDKGVTDVTLYLIISLACVSFVSLLTMVVLVVRCLQHGGTGIGNLCCYGRHTLRSRHNQRRAHKNLHLQLNTHGPVKYMEVVGSPLDPTAQNYYSTLSSRSDFVFVRSPMSNPNNPLSMTLSRKHLITSNNQNPPNTDWRFSQNQRPGPSGASPEEATGVVTGTGPWPNPPTEAEQLQALMAAANEVSEATATLGPGSRYGPQLTLQRAPDFRQNVYIPGSTATLTANPPQQALPPPQAQVLPPSQADAPKAAQTPASKKKVAKKDKK
uniref:Protocadherin gamma-A11-like n=1 Tax=Scleropages formosus TaxID=113540 RepID=A0A8C9UZK1_SCLFO